MEWMDRQLREWEAYLPELTRLPDFDEFWEETRREADSVELAPVRVKIDDPAMNADVYEISYAGFGGLRIYGWMLIPKDVSHPAPCVIQYHGFGGNRGEPWEYQHWVSLGTAVIAVDCRGQSGKTGHAGSYTGGNCRNIVCTGLSDPREFYYRAVYMDCVRALDFACAQPELDANRLAVTGGSQGGALTMAVAALDDRPFLAMPDVPSNSNLELRVIGEYGSFGAVADYLRWYPEEIGQVFRTLSYFDTMNLADRIHCPVLASVGGKDDTCPPKCYYATYNRITAPKEIVVYPFNYHEGGGSAHVTRKMRFLKEHL